MLRARLCVVIIIALALAASAHAQDERRWLFNIGGGIGLPQGDLASFVNNGGHFVVGGGINFDYHFALASEFMWHDFPINSATKQHLQTPGAGARQYAWTFNPIFHFRMGPNWGAYVIGGGGWYHRSGETTTPGPGVVCDPYWAWWSECTIGTVDIVTASRSSDTFGENIGGGLTYRIGESPVMLYTEARYHHASYNKLSTNIVPLTFGIRW